MANNSVSDYAAYKAKNDVAGLGLYIHTGLADLLHVAAKREGISRDAFVRRELSAAVNRVLPEAKYTYPSKENLKDKLSAAEEEIARLKAALAAHVPTPPAEKADPKTGKVA